MTWLETTRELRKSGWRVTLIGQGPADGQSIRGVEVLSIPHSQRYAFGSLEFHLRLIRYLLARLKTIDIILFHQLSAPWLLPIRFLSQWMGGKRPILVMDTRDQNAVDGSLRNRMRISYFKFAHRISNRWADGQTAITERMAVLAHIPPEQLLGIWPSGVDAARFGQVQKGRRWPEGNEPVQLIYLGKLHSERNLLPLCQAVEQASAEGMAFVLTLIGAGAQQLTLEQFAEQSRGRVRVHEAVPHERVPEVLSQAHIGVTSLPSPDDRKFQASSPVKLFEYMASGLPILTTKNFCHVDVVGDRGFAFWVEDETVASLYAPLKLIWKERHLLRAKGRKAASAVGEWTWTASAAKLSTALEKGLLRHPIPSPSATQPNS
jgi:glycosyltransferase involved in cell wall biosynthesis